MVFTDNAPSGIRRGQTVRIRLELGESKQAVFIAYGRVL
jgi:HlyD family secretion protein